MSHARVLGLIGVAALAVGAVAYAQSTITPVQENAPVEAAPLDAAAMAKTTWGDAKAGQQKAAACAACHGVDGNPAIADYPRIAGMPERYTAHQLMLFKTGERNSGMAAVMQPFAAPLSPQDMRDLGAYFATQKAQSGVADEAVIAQGPYAGKKFYEVGQQLFRNGNAERGLPACMACHGPAGGGNPGPAYPSLAGQQAAYSQRRLEEYRAGVTQRRDPALFNIMASVAKQLTDEEILALSSYMQGLHDRRGDMAKAGTAPAAAAPAAAPAATTPAPAQPEQAAAPASGT